MTGLHYENNRKMMVILYSLILLLSPKRALLFAKLFKFSPTPVLLIRDGRVTKNR
jgi:hypothetical protein